MLWKFADTDVRLALFVGVDAREFHVWFSSLRDLVFVRAITGSSPE